MIKLDEIWKNLKDGSWKTPVKPIVFDNTNNEQLSLLKTDYDVIVSGGTLGIFYAVALQKKGYKICILENINQIFYNPHASVLLTYFW